MLVLQGEPAAGSTAVQGRARRLVAGGGRTSSGLPTASVCFPIPAPAPLPWPPPWCRLQALPFPVWLVRRILMKHLQRAIAAHSCPCSAHTPPSQLLLCAACQGGLFLSAASRASSAPPHTALCTDTSSFSPITSQLDRVPEAISSLLFLTAAPGVRTAYHPSCTDGETRQVQLGHCSGSLSSKALARVLPLTRMSHLRFPAPPWLALW